jgi:hypothetical protein
MGARNPGAMKDSQTLLLEIYQFSSKAYLSIIVTARPLDLIYSINT